MGILNRIRSYRERRAYKRTILWRQRNTPYGEMLGKTIAYRRRVEPPGIAVTPERQAALGLMKTKVRTTFLSHPAATEADFERCWPMLRDEIFKQYTLKHLEVEQAAGVMPLLSDVMITKEQVMPLLLDACPSFTEKWREHRAFYEDEDLLYVDLGEFAHHLVTLHKADLTDEFPAVFEIIERLHLEGDPYVKEAATIGLLEGIQNVAGNSGVNPEEFSRYLKPESAKWWRQLNDFWEGKIPVVGSYPNEA